MPPPVPPARRTARSGNKGRRLDSAQARAAPLAGLAVFKVSLRYSQIGAWQAEFRTKEAAIRFAQRFRRRPLRSTAQRSHQLPIWPPSSAFTQMEHFRSQTSRRSVFWLLASRLRHLRRELGFSVLSLVSYPTSWRAQRTTKTTPIDAQRYVSRRSYTSLSQAAADSQISQRRSP